MPRTWSELSNSKSPRRSDSWACGRTKRPPIPSNPSHAGDFVPRPGQSISSFTNPKPDTPRRPPLTTGPLSPLLTQPLHFQPGTGCDGNLETLLPLSSLCWGSSLRSSSDCRFRGFSWALLVLAHYVDLQRPLHASPQLELATTTTRWSPNHTPTRVPLMVRHPSLTTYNRHNLLHGPRTARLPRPQGFSVLPTPAPPCHCHHHNLPRRTRRLLYKTVHSCILCRPTKFESESLPRFLSFYEKLSRNHGPSTPTGRVVERP